MTVDDPIGSNFYTPNTTNYSQWLMDRHTWLLTHKSVYRLIAFLPELIYDRSSERITMDDVLFAMKARNHEKVWNADEIDWADNHENYIKRHWRKRHPCAV